MPSPITVKVKVQPYIKKYLIAKSIEKTEPIQFCRHHPYNKSLIDKVSIYNRHTFFPINEKDTVYNYFFNRWTTFESVTIQLPYNRRKNVLYFNYLSRDRQQEFITEIKEDFHHELYWYMITRRRKGIQRKDIIRDFMEKYDISEDDISFDSIYRQTSRILQQLFEN